MTNAVPQNRRRLILLGSTGSIGTNTLRVVQHLRTEGVVSFDVIGLATGTNVETLAEQARQFNVKHVAVANGDPNDVLAEFPNVYTGPNAATELIDAVAQTGDLVVGAMVGAAGVPATLNAIERGCDIALANKETLVAAGDLVLPKVKEHGVMLLPIDSEHSAIFQCLQAGRSVDPVQRLIVTASGGPFRTWPKDRLYNATVEQTLDHPTWNMGPKITVDSASLMNKALEVIEAHWLFGLPGDKIDVVIHPQSIIHSFVEFVDGSVIAQLSPPDMKMPIQYALTWPQRIEGCSPRMDWSQLHRFELEPVDHDRFPALQLAYEVIGVGGTAGAIFNAANEAAVEAFLAGSIPFGRITELVSEVLRSIQATPVTSLADVMSADAAARTEVQRRLAQLSQRACDDVAVRSSTSPG